MYFDNGCWYMDSFPTVAKLIFRLMATFKELREKEVNCICIVNTGASGRTRTGTPNRQKILSLSWLPLHHTRIIFLVRPAGLEPAPYKLWVCGTTNYATVAKISLYWWIILESNQVCREAEDLQSSAVASAAHYPNFWLLYVRTLTPVFLKVYVSAPWRCISLQRKPSNHDNLLFTSWMINPTSSWWSK